MTNFIPIFPLSLVVYPGEQLNLHIFEPRYKQLIIDCFEKKKPFGIPSVINNSIEEYGCSVVVEQIVATYDNGEMDIIAHAQHVFRILEVIKDIPDKLYRGAIVSYPHNNVQGSTSLRNQTIELLKQLHAQLHIKKDMAKEPNEWCSYDVAHLSCLSPQQEYELLQLFNENQRMEYIKQHITSMLPSLKNIESLMDRVKRNGHFRNLKGYDLNHK